MVTAVKVGALSCAAASALFFAWWGVLIATKIFDDYKDSTDFTYLFIGGVLSLLAVTIVIGTLVSGLPQHMTRGAILLSAALAATLTAVALLYLYYGPSSEPPSLGDHRVPTMDSSVPGGDPGLATPTIGTPLPQR